MNRHLKFWDKKDKGYITPIDTISGFMTLGYNMLFSVTIGAMVSVLLSLSTQTGWIPDPLCRSNTKRIISLTKEQTSSGAFDEKGVFVPDQFEQLFNKYAKSDPSGNTITFLEFIQMTKEQEKLDYRLKAWAAGIVELMTAYFFIGHRGTLYKQDVCAIYDGTLFYRLKDTNRYTTQNQSLQGPYLAKPSGPLSIKSIQTQLKPWYYKAQAGSLHILSYYELDEWLHHVQQSNLLPRVLKNRQHSLQGVHTPKLVHKKKAKPQELDNLMPQGLTGVKIEEESLIPQDTYLTSFFSKSDNDSFDNLGLSGVKGSHSDVQTSYSPLLLSSNTVLGVSEETVQASSYDYAPSLTKSVSTSSNESALQETPIMTGFLREGQDMSCNWLTEGAGLTGVQTGENKELTETLIPPASDRIREDIESPILPQENISPIMDTKEPETFEQANEVLEQEDETIEQTNETIEPSITPPPEEHYVDKPIPPTPPAHERKKNKKKVKKNKKNTSGQISPHDSVESGPEQSANTPIDTSWGITK
ncbi:Caleosin related protein-domain-containing protein [Blakeslea trispora]|nr:Caleosin related protein-domain-containing protein [Blakeslea trispora]